MAETVQSYVPGYRLRTNPIFKGNKVTIFIEEEGAGAGNTQTEVLVAVLDRMGIQTGVDLYKMMDLAEEIVAPILQPSRKLRETA